MIVSKVVGKWDVKYFVLNALEDSLFNVSKTDVHEDSSYTLTKNVSVNIPEDQLPDGFFTTHRYTSNKVEGTDVSFGVNIDARRGLSIDINFAYSLFLSRKRSEEGRQLIRDNVAAEFAKVNFLDAARKALESIMSHSIADLNKREEDKVARFFENSAADKANELLEKAQNPEWQHLKNQEEQLIALLEGVKARKSVLRKEALIKELDKDEREFPENIQSIVNDELINADGIRKRSLFRRY